MNLASFSTFFKDICKNRSQFFLLKGMIAKILLHKLETISTYSKIREVSNLNV